MLSFIYFCLNLIVLLAVLILFAIQLRLCRSDRSPIVKVLPLILVGLLTAWWLAAWVGAFGISGGCILEPAYELAHSTTIIIHMCVILAVEASAWIVYWVKYRRKN